MARETKITATDDGYVLSYSEVTEYRIELNTLEEAQEHEARVLDVPKNPVPPKTLTPCDCGEREYCPEPGFCGKFRHEGMFRDPTPSERDDEAAEREAWQPKPLPKMFCPKCNMQTGGVMAVVCGDSECPLGFGPTFAYDPTPICGTPYPPHWALIEDEE